MARVVTIIGNICYGSGKFLHIGEKYDLEDPSLDKQIKSILVDQLAAGRTVCEGEPGTPFRKVGAYRASTSGVASKKPTAVAEDAAQEAADKEAHAEDTHAEDTVSADSAVEELVSTATLRRKSSK